MDTGGKKGVMNGMTTASQLLLFIIKHTVSGLAWPQEQCLRVYERIGKTTKSGPVESS